MIADEDRDTKMSLCTSDIDEIATALAPHEMHIVLADKAIGI